MDPSVTWCDLAQAFTERRWADAREIARKLLEWLEKGGFPPVISTVAAFDKFSEEVIP